MHPKRRQRLLIVIAMVAGVSLGLFFLFQALSENVNFFYSPDQIVHGEAPTDVRVRAGGMVKDGSVQREPGSLEVQFVIWDMKASSFPVRYAGILPDLFREGQGIIVSGRLGPDGAFRADEVLAKHDENYMPPELEGMGQP